MVINLSAGIAAGPTGYLHAVTGTTAISVTGTPAASTQGRRTLVVVRPVLTDNTFITNPVSPFNTVPLEQTQGTQVVVIEGTDSATPDYPATQVNDVVLFGLKIPFGVTGLTSDNLDLEIRDVPGKNADNLGKSQRYDDRLRPYRSSAKVLGIKPSQLPQPFPSGFIYPGKSQPSHFPKDVSGLFNANDTFLDFSTGLITGGDASSSAFTPTAPTGTNAVVAAVSLNGKDEILVNYGTQGTYAQCSAAIKSQTLDGAGAVPFTTNYKVAYVIVQSIGGAVSEIQMLDARGLGMPIGFEYPVVAGENLTALQPIYISIGGADGGRTAGDAYKCDSSAALGPNRYQFAGFVIETVLSGSTARVRTAGKITTSGLTPGATYYVDPATPGGITSTRPVTANQFMVPVGVAASATELEINASLSAPAAIVTASVSTDLWTEQTITSGQSPFTVNSTTNKRSLFLVDTSGGAVQLNLPAPVDNFVFAVVDKLGNFNTNACTLHRNGGEKLQGLAADYVMEAQWGAWQWQTNGTDYWLEN
jgi:hypothetical protein